MQIVNLSPEAIHYLAAAATGARIGERGLRVAIDGNAFKFKLGEGIWSPPFYDQPDPYRDLGAAQHESHDLSRFEDHPERDRTW